MTTSAAWESSPAGSPPSPLPLGLLLVPLVVCWTLPQTLAGLALGLWRRRQGYRPHLYRFGPFIYVVFRAPGPACAGISLGVVIFAQAPQILKHELSHLITGLWLSWLYLPVYGLEYLLWGHDRSPHERLTCWLTERLPWGWQLVI